MEYSSCRRSSCRELPFHAACTPPHHGACRACRRASARVCAQTAIELLRCQDITMPTMRGHLLHLVWASVQSPRWTKLAAKPVHMCGTCCEVGTSAASSHPATSPSIRSVRTVCGTAWLAAAARWRPTRAPARFTGSPTTGLRTVRARAAGRGKRARSSPSRSVPHSPSGVCCVVAVFARRELARIWQMAARAAAGHAA